MYITSWTCSSVDSSTTSCLATATSSNSTSTPVYVQDDGAVTFGLSVIIVILSLMLVGMIFNKLFKTR